jgi:hypothetical protein
VDKARERVLRAAEALDRANVPYAVVDGNAVAAWVSRVDESAVRTTRDVDILLRRSDLESAKIALSAVGFVHRRVSGLGMPGVMDLFLDGQDATPRDAIHIVPASERVRPDNLLPAPDVTESEDGGQFRLVTLVALVRMKLTSFRDKDRIHLRDLIDLGLVDRGWLPELPEVLRPRLLELLDNPHG